MHDSRFDKLAKVLVEYSTRLKRNETVLIESFDVPDEMTIALGFRVKSGYAIAVALRGPASAPTVVARRVDQLSDPAVPETPLATSPPVTHYRCRASRSSLI